MTDIEIQTRIKAAFQGLLETPSLKQFTLTFTIGGKTFNTRLTAKCEKLGGKRKGLHLFWFRIQGSSKNCIDVSIVLPTAETNLASYKNLGYGEFQSLIQANSPTQKCFDPILTSNRNNPNVSARYSTTDVLQILKTKLQLLIPNPTKIPIGIDDAATISQVRMTPFFILRGKAPFYYKYGYKYPGLAEIFTALPSLTWGQIKDAEYYKVDKQTVSIAEGIFAITQKNYEDTDLVVDIVNSISFDEESKHNLALLEQYTPDRLGVLYSPYFLSSAIVRAIKATLELTEPLYIAVLDPESAEWKQSSDRLQLVGFEPVAEGGRRRKTRRRKTRRHHQKKLK